MPAIAAYCRVSSKSQDLALQRDAIESDARARGDTVELWFNEQASAGSMKRRELDRLRALVREGKVRKVYAFRLDRLCRTGPADTFALVSELHRAGCELVTVSDGLTVKGTEDDIVTTTLLFALGLAAQLERNAIRERLERKRQLVEARGGAWGRPRERGKAEEDKVARAVAGGLSHREVARKLHLPKATVTLLLKRAQARKP